MSLSNLDMSGLTMIMMTGNRPRMFRDAMEQYAVTVPQLKIFVGDFSAEEARGQNAATAARHSGTVEYFAFEPATPWPVRFRFLIERCATPFVVIAADDDFLLADGLRESLAFMQQHPDYAACHGSYFQVVPGNEPGQIAVAADPNYLGRAHESSDPIGRLMSILFWYNPIYYTMQRREDLRRLEVPAAVRSGVMNELYTACATVIAGKIGRVQSPYCLTNRTPTPASSAIYSLADLIMLGGEALLEEYVPVRNGLVALLVSAYGTHRNWRRLVDIAFASHLRRSWPDVKVWSLLANEGEIPPEDVAVLATAHPSESTPVVDLEYLKTYLVPLASHGWPAYG